jgi:hypothetical protein
MKNFKFNLRSLEEMYSYGLVDPIDSIFEFMHQEIKNGNSIVFEQQHLKNEHSSPIFFTENSSLNDFYNEFSKKNCPPLDLLLEQRQRINSKPN